MHIENDKFKNAHTSTNVFFIDVKPKLIIIKRMPSNSNEAVITDTLIRNKTTNHNGYKVINTANGGYVLIFRDKYLDVTSKEENGKRTEMSFYNE